MTSETFQKAAEANKRIELYNHLQKVLNASGVETIIHPELQARFGKDFIQLLRDDLLPSVNSKLEQAKTDLENL